MPRSPIEAARVVPSQLEDLLASIEPRPTSGMRSARGWPALLAVPAAYALGRALGSHRAGLAAGALALLGVGALRWQLARWFAPTPAYEPLGRAGTLELRRYPFCIEARTEVAAPTLEEALAGGYARLECYLCGANEVRELLDEVTPVLTSQDGGVYRVAIVMPPYRSARALPLPDDLRVELREIPERRVAVLPLRGQLATGDVAGQASELARALAEAGLVPRGTVTLATYDGPTTLPVLRRSELWIDVV